MEEVLAKQYAAADARWLRLWMQGPTKTSYRQLPVQVGEPAPDVELIDSEGNPVRLSNFWKESPLHLFFLRHYGCSCMKERWGQLREEYPKLREAGAQMVAIGMGEPERTQLFIKVREIPAPVLCDPEQRAYTAYGIIEGTPPAILHNSDWQPDDEETGRKMMDSRRDTDRRLVDNPWILPAEFIIDQKGVIRHSHRYQYCEDFPPTTVLLGAIRAAKQS
ncbi:MAG: AhpC/TSA family protein [Chloroflexi bacterium]|nr:AhpC/TSA family protein [Chloroflexota bacterium]